MNTKTRTTKEWLDTLPEPYRSQALMNTPYEGWGEDRRDLEDALWGAFIWEDSPEGHNYWKSLAVRAEDGEFDIPEADPVCPLPVPDGYSHWEYRGKGWSSKGQPGSYAAFSEVFGEVMSYHLVDGSYKNSDYWEAIPLAKPAVVGYRLLGPDDVIREGDEVWHERGDWSPALGIGFNPGPRYVRRRPILSYEDAPASS